MHLLSARLVQLVEHWTCSLKFAGSKPAPCRIFSQLDSMLWKASASFVPLCLVCPVAIGTALSTELVSTSKGRQRMGRQLIPLEVLEGLAN